eukprot:CAMPEP_0118946516 /NCGR_PEP_ID=MMETSP1169-20130426/44333_1 /TAXON_ID=36882 /ORGANISM="Pyramimonas obovata, Strain CCMP722" /LENGTH=505 /DNA_ID=CAMNT_0006892505 /DNA_START=323 /DNA_END=1840 /DNA_ORIENTATION=+
MHFLVHNYGKQTWEHSPEFALRSSLYLAFHTLVAAPVSLLFGGGAGKVVTFHLLRVFLGTISAACEAYLYHATRQVLGVRVSSVLLLLLAVSTGMFSASTAFLPSSFTMYTMTLATAALLLGRYHLVIAACAVGALLGWPFGALAMLPLCLYVLLVWRLRALKLAIFWAAVVVLPQLAADRAFYGKWTLGLLNILAYNVAGGGSELYGTEGPLFYLKNCLLNFNVIFLFALALPLVAFLARCHMAWPERLAVVYAPLPLWLIAMSSAAHKEERFMYLVYPTVCLAAACTLHAVPTLLCAPIPKKYHSTVRWAGDHLVRIVLAGVVILSVMRTSALLLYYGGAGEIFRALPPLPATGATSGVAKVCMGSDWYRFPSSFLLPSPEYRLGFLESDFGGLLPADFDSARGGTSWAPEWLNKFNRADNRSYVPITSCQYLVEQSRLPLQVGNIVTKPASNSGGATRWQVLATTPFLDTEHSPALTRILYIPRLSSMRNTYTTYALLQQSK